jgi:hypothetical protein
MIVPFLNESSKLFWLPRQGNAGWSLRSVLDGVGISFAPKSAKSIQYTAQDVQQTLAIRGKGDGRHAVDSGVCKVPYYLARHLFVILSSGPSNRYALEAVNLYHGTI